MVWLSQVTHPIAKETLTKQEQGRTYDQIIESVDLLQKAEFSCAMCYETVDYQNVHEDDCGVVYCHHCIK